jgi:hypothetical protein
MAASSFFDSSLLAEAGFCCVVLTDLHFIPEEGIPGVEEFPCRGKQTVRSRTALEMAGALRPDMTLHLGDYTQAFPESPGFDQSMAAAESAVKASGLSVHSVAGNQDIGDKADPTMPARPVDGHTLELFQKRFGPTWYTLEAGGVRWVVANSQILNRPDLPQWGEQRQWLEKTLADAAGQRIFLMFHLPPYIHDPEEPGLGHYDNIGQPDRAWLLDLIRRHGVERWFTGHVHWRFYDHLDRCIGQSCPSTAFTRPGFSTAFTSAPPSEQGRNDEPKLGFLLLRVGTDYSETVLVRTGGMEKVPAAIASGERQWLLTRTSGTIEHSPLGVTLIHPLAAETQTPLAWPSSVRQPLRNDYPLLALIELGARHLRVMDVDVSDPVQRRRLEIAGDEGMSLTAMGIDMPLESKVPPTPSSAEGIANDSDSAQAVPPSNGFSVKHSLARNVSASEGTGGTLELRLPGGELFETVADKIRRIQSGGRAVSLSPVLPNDKVPGKQHLRTRNGFTPGELSELDGQLAALDVRVERAVCRIGPDQSPWAYFGELAELKLKQIGAIDVTLELTTDDRENARRCAEALMGCAALPGARLFIEPLADMDRTMDVRHGLIDAQSNPRPPFHAVRCLNTVLFSRGRDWQRIDGPVPQVRRQGVSVAYAAHAEQIKRLPPRESLRVYRLEECTVGHELPAEMRGPVVVEWEKS